MKVSERKKSANKFISRWSDRGDEKQHTQSFWLELLSEVYGVSNPTNYINFELPVKNMRTSNFIDGFIEKTKVLIEQKSYHINLDKGEKQSDGAILSPFQQAFRYNNHQPYEKKARWIIVSNFQEIRIHDMNNPYGTPAVIELTDLNKEYYRLDFLIDKTNEDIEKETKVSIEAGELIGEIYNELLEQYNDPDSPHTLESINVLSVRLVFCFYAEDAGLFSHKGAFRDYLEEFPTAHFRKAVIDLFDVLDTPEDERDPYIDDKLGAFPYVNGGLFEQRNVEIPNFTDHLRELILKNATSEFDWSEISPTIFGGVFESTLNPEQRREGGMHYTSIENIHKIIDPLFLDDLKEELAEIQQMKQVNRQTKRALEFQDKLANMKFLDPACGSGNFLTETYLSLRELENQVFTIIYGDSPRLGVIDDFIKVSLDQFYGIEINDFAVSTATTALWIAESQMFEKTKELVYTNVEFFPLKSYINIVEGNALTENWNSVVDARELDYIMGNPPFIGSKLMDKNQREEINALFNIKSKGNLDYVTGWFKKAFNFIKNTDIKTAFVSTSSIVEGELVSMVWEEMMAEGLVIEFAHTSFKWMSETSKSAQVYVVIVGFRYGESSKQKTIYTDSVKNQVDHINAYLLDAPDIFVKRLRRQLYDIPKLHKGCQPTDGGNLIIESDEIDDFLRKEPMAEKYIKKLIGGREFLQNKDRYCLWLVEATPAELRSMPLVMDRIQKTKEMRLEANSKGTQKLAETPHLFRETYNYDNYLVVPKLTSSNRRYIPMGYFGSDVISTDLNYITSEATLYHFGILQSNVHMAWTRVVSGRMGNAFRYSAGVVYNTFPWPNPTEKQKERIEKTAQSILEARDLYPDSTLTDLYDELTMPVELRKAHQENDKAAMLAYGMEIGPTTEDDAVAKLFEMYEKLIEEQNKY